MKLIILSFGSIFCLSLSMLLYPVSNYAQEKEDIKLLDPRVEGGRPLMQVLKNRKSSREFRNEDIPLQILSDMLWAACGINRPESGKRTAPSARNMQAVDVYVALSSGLYLFDPKNQVLDLVLQKDIRELTGKQDFVKDAPVNFIYVADFSKMKDLSDDDAGFYAAADTGFISQNVYLYCSSEGLATVVRGWFDKKALSETMGLKSGQKVILTQSVGYPKE